ncbi:MAG: type II toxin-antitoxin system RelE/ParE family toxin [Allorhizobium sp.]
MNSSFGRRYRLSPQAVEDLIQIYNYLYERRPVAAERFTRDIEQKITDLAGSRNPVVSRDWLKPGLRAFSLSPPMHLLPYRRRHSCGPPHRAWTTRHHVRYLP